MINNSSFHIPTLETERLFLEPLDSRYANSVLQFYKDNSDHFDPFELTRPENFYTYDFHRSVLDWEEQQMKEYNCLRYFVFLKEDPSFILGTLNASGISMGTISKCSIGYKIDYRFVGHGFATEASKKLVDFLFDAYNLHRIYAEILPKNTASINVIKNLGFTYEGTEREGAQINGKWEDLMLFSKLSTDA